MENLILQGDCLEVLKRYPDNFFDSVVTDPPYGLSKEPNITEVLTKWVAGESYDHGHGGFMGKSWDSFVPHPDVWKEVYRVLKPGGHALVFAGTRTQDLMTIALRLGGFEIRDVIEWLYFSGFPKSMDVGKAFDKRRDEDVEPKATVSAWFKGELLKRGITPKELDEWSGIKGAWQKWTTSRLDGAFKPRVPTWEQWESIKSWLQLSDEMDAEVWRLNGRKGKPGDAWEGAEVIGEYEGTPGGFGEYRFSVSDSFMRAPATDLARKWDGWGTALKPAHEPIIVARKPLAGTVAETVEKYGTGAININGCRIGRVEGDPTEYGVNGDEPSDVTAGIYGKFAERMAYKPHDAGRFPANCVTTYEDAFYSPYFNVTPRKVCRKASKADRNADWAGTEITLQESESKKFSGGDFAKNGDGTPRSRNGGMLKNTHPTVKPTDLMAWLVRLVTPQGGTVLDPFAGSGSTLVAAKREGFRFIGVEMEQDYHEIASARLETAAGYETLF